MRTKRKIVNERFGKLTALEITNEKRNHSRMVLCRCDCGKEKLIRDTDLLSGMSASCGCSRGKPLENGEASRRASYRTYKIGAKSRDLDFSLSFDEFSELTALSCYYCGEMPKNIFKNRYGKGDFTYNGIDRVDNSKGYTTSNVVPCCKICNVAKHAMSRDAFLVWVAKVYYHSINISS